MVGCLQEVFYFVIMASARSRELDVMMEDAL